MDVGYSRRGVGYGYWAEEEQQKVKKNRPKKGLIFVTAGAPGRGVLRFLRGGYRRPVHFSAKNAVFSKN